MLKIEILRYQNMCMNFYICILLLHVQFVYSPFRAMNKVRERMSRQTSQLHPDSANHIHVETFHMIGISLSVLGHTCNNATFSLVWCRPIPKYSRILYFSVLFSTSANTDLVVENVIESQHELLWHQGSARKLSRTFWKRWYILPISTNYIWVTHTCISHIV